MKYLNIILLVIALFISMNCSMCDGGGGGTKPPSIEEQIQKYITNGWIEFEKANYDSAELLFDEAIVLSNDHTEANAGKGWTVLMQDESSSYSTIENMLTIATGDSTIINDVRAALAIVTNLQKKYSSSIDYVDLVLAKTSLYEFQHKTDITFEDLLVIQAHSYFYNKQFDEAYETILKLNTDYSAFDPDDSSSWVVDGDQYPSYEGAISAVLAKVAEEYKSF